MTEYWMEWASLLFRWLHVITAIAWIGSSFYFVWLDLSLKKIAQLPEGVQGESWSVHGGGFYHVQKYMVAPTQMPAELHWFKYESYFTWISGFCLLVVTYYWSAQAYLIDSAVADLSVKEAIGVSVGSLVMGWFVYDFVCKSPIGKNLIILGFVVYIIVVTSAFLYSEIFSSRAALLHVGAMVATWMTGNVFFIIIPNQKKVVASLKRKETPNPALGMQAKQRSMHNNYLTLPVLFMMLSNHYPITFVGENLWILVGCIVLIGAIIRDYFNASHSDSHGLRVKWQWPVALGLVICLGIWTTPQAIKTDFNREVVTNAEVQNVLSTHCSSCHMRNPSGSGFAQAPQGVVLETLDDIKKYKQQIKMQAVNSQAMPPGNLTKMTDIERMTLGSWIDSN